MYSLEIQEYLLSYVTPFPKNVNKNKTNWSHVFGSSLSFPMSSNMLSEGHISEIGLEDLSDSDEIDFGKDDKEILVS